MRRDRHAAGLILAVLAFALAACSTENVESNYTGINLRPEWLKTFAITKIPFTAVKDDGTEAFLPGTIDVSTVTSTSVLLSLIYPIALTEMHIGEMLTLSLEGRSAEDALLAVGTGTATLRKGQLYPLRIRLHAPGACGDGALQTEERCDDGNTTAGDGCDDACATEEGWICVRTPSRCFPESMTALVGPAALAAAILDAGKPYLILRSGTYTEPLVLAANSKTLIAQEGAVLDVSGGDRAILIAGGGSVGIVGLEVRGGGVLVDGPGSSASLEEMRIGPSDQVGAESSGGASLRITRTRVAGNARGGVMFGGGLFRVESSIIEGNGSASSSIGGVYIVGGTGASSIENSTIVENVVPTASSTAAGVHCALPTNLTNDIVFANSGGAAVSSDCMTSACDLSPPGGTMKSGGRASISEDPKLSPDLHLLPGSPCIDAGEDLGSTNAKDIDGDVRPQGDAFDIGADEAR